MDSKVVFGLVIFGLILVYSNTVTSANGQTPWPIHKPDVFNGGKYSDPQNGIEITFPDGWSGHKMISENTTVIVVSKNSTGFLFPTISLEVINKSIIQDMVNFFTKLAKNPVIAQKANSLNKDCDVTNSTISVNGMGGFGMTMQCSDFPLKMEYVMFATDRNIVALIYQANSTEFEKYGVDYNNTLNTLTISNAVKQFNPATILLPTADKLNSTIPTLHHTYQNNISPRYQMTNGILPDNVICYEGKILIKKSSTNSIACVKPQTAQKLVERGWKILSVSTIEQSNNLTILPNIIKVTNANFTINYEITGGKVTEIIQDKESKSVVISVKTTSHGKLTITIPRALFDATYNDHDDKFYILVDGQHVDYTEMKTTATDRTVIIPFNKGSEEIEFVGTQILSGH